MKYEWSPGTHWPKQKTYLHDALIGVAQIYINSYRENDSGDTLLLWEMKAFFFCFSLLYGFWHINGYYSHLFYLKWTSLTLTSKNTNFYKRNEFKHEHNHFYESSKFHMLLAVRRRTFCSRFRRNDMQHMGIGNKVVFRSLSA